MLRESMPLTTKWNLPGAAWALLLFAGVVAGRHGSAAQAVHAAVDKRQALVQELCSKCHPMETISARRTRSQWEDILYKMIDLGAKGSDKQFRAALDYLASDYGRVNVNRGPASELSAVLGLTRQQAGSIVRYRREHGKFENIDALAEMLGMDVGEFEKVREAMSF